MQMPRFCTDKERLWFSPVQLLHLHFLDGFHGTPIEGGFMPSIPYYPVLQIHDSSERGVAQRAELKKLRDWWLEAFVEQST
tara:strand:+ start:200 stop:442 length:243 start_codon:yes stop_codon:yes gene_type:complete